MSRIARLIALYLDFLTFFVVITLVAYAIGEPSFLSWSVRTVVSAGLSAAGAYFGLSLGQWLVAEIVNPSVDGSLPKAAWLNLLVGALFYLDASKHLVRWIEMDRPMPIMGIVPEGGMQIAADVGLGLAFLFMSILMLRLHPLGKWVAGVGLTLLIVSTVVSWSQLPEAISRYVQARRDVQGLPVRDGEIEQMQAFYPPFLLASTGLLLLLVLLSYSRSLHRSAE
jgi:hypothetical protein